ncbi:AraC family transcriptional regulator [Bordetella trematum]|uniref:AraC family transcriptional regulator n=1 Tax=Bordetella trematum TaxID=123899 RepID=UPI000D8F0AAD|nr:helix-turn-helix transcriptional regulator [Bordetella trematum]SPU49438.1 transcriptional regulator [Bordetella trematum]VDH08821.1 HTH-type transcriptional repressor of iron proteins A [Bordetella trematum]
MKNQSVDAVDHLDRAVLAIGTDYADGQLLSWHHHRRAQLLYGATGVMQVSAGAGAWVVPSGQAVWIPAGMAHQVRMLGVSTRSLYIEPASAPRPAAQCEVLAVSALLRELLLQAVEMPPEYDEQGRDGALVTLLLHEVGRAPSLPLHIPLPRDDAALLALCQRFLAAPRIDARPQAWARSLHVSERTLQRRFRQAIGLSFAQWRQRACLAQALAALAQGAPVTTVALDLGYDSPGAFSTMVRRVLGRPPSALAARQPVAGHNAPACL